MWYNDIGPEKREKLFAAMRALDSEAQRQYEKAKKLTPPSGTIGVGGADFEELLKAEVISSYLRPLRNGKTPAEALANAEKDRTEFVKKFNQKRGKDYVVHRSETAEQSLIDRIHRTILNAVK